MHKYVAHVWNRHWGNEEKVGLYAHTLREAADKLARDKGKVRIIKEVKSFPRDLDSTIYVSH